MKSSLIAATALIAAASWASTTCAAPALNDVNSRDLQRLLRVQSDKVPADFASPHLPRVAHGAYDHVLLWNEIALDTTAIDHTPVRPGETRVFGEQFGPPRASRAMAIVHIAMFEAINAVHRRYRSYTGLAPVGGDVSVALAVARASHDAQAWLYPSQRARLDTLFAEDADAIEGSPASLAAGDALGAEAARSIIAMRVDDGSQFPDPTVGVDFTPIGGLGHWSPDPVSRSKIALGAFWGRVRPFVLTSASQFRSPPPPSLTSPLYTAAFLLTDALGGDPAHGTPTVRNPDETQQGIFWTYDGVPEICAPPRLYNQVARTLVIRHGLRDAEDLARFLALLNTSMADVAIAAWDSKWHYQFWRPVTAIRGAAAVGNPLTPGNAAWYPLGGQATNTHGPNFTPPFPAYPSGHAALGGAVFQTIRHFLPDDTAFTFVSDEFNGRNYSSTGQLMPLEPVRYKSLAEAEYDNAESRIWIGVHWQFDSDQGIATGHSVADWVFDHAFQPID